MSNRSRSTINAIQAPTAPRRSDGEAATARLAGHSAANRSQHGPATTLRGCQRVLVLGRTGSGKTTLARALSDALELPHVELDSLYFEDNFTAVPLSVLRDRTSGAITKDRWIADGNKSAVRDLCWPRADSAVWLDYPLVVCLWRLGKRAMWRTSVLTKRAAATGEKAGLLKQLLSAARGVLSALRSHMGQRREYPRMFAQPENQHLAVVRLRSPGATRRWLSRVTEGGTTAS
jgi:hypothetical protein